MKAIIAVVGVALFLTVTHATMFDLGRLHERALQHGER